jgi:transcriptional regulator with XRE-family HTH domain
MNTFGEKLREARKNKNLTQKELADLINAKHNSISNWENDQNKPDPDTIELLCGALDIDPNYLLSKSGIEANHINPNNENIIVNNLEKTLVENYRKADEIDKKIVLRTLHINDTDFSHNIVTISANSHKKNRYIPTEEDIKSLVARNGKKLTREEAIDIISTLFSDEEE